jgi:HSP20 family molecular chaperone IbpA
MYCDLVFHQENEQFIQWMENLENSSQKMIYTNRERWFQTELEMDDIENTFTSPMKIYKSGKSYIVRAAIPNRLGKPVLKIYDEDEKDISYDEMKEGSQVMVILEIQGIRCSARSFQIEIELKQMMVMKPSDLFNRCILKKKTTENTYSEAETAPEPETDPESFIMIKPKTIDENLGKAIPSDVLVSCINNDTSENIVTEPPVEIKIDTSNQDINELCEVDFNLDEMSETETISIKQRNDVYYKMYREAREKAKIARDLALSAYLEAKRIKNTYMLDDIIDSSDSEESDDEFDEEDSNE